MEPDRPPPAWQPRIPGPIIFVDFNPVLRVYKCQSGHSSVGRVQASQAWGRGFEARCPLQYPLDFLLAFGLNLCYGAASLSKSGKFPLFLLTALFMDSSLIESIRELAEPAILSQGLELVDIEFCREPRGWVLRFYIDHEGGVTLEHCSRLSQQLGDIIDVKGIIPHHYILEVSSPGVNRVLKSEKDFLRHLGEVIKVKLAEPIDGRKNFQGALVGCSDNTILVAIDEQRHCIPISLIAKANISYQFPEPHTKKGKKAR